MKVDMKKSVNESLAELAELSEVYTQIFAVSGYSANQLLDMFLNGCTMVPPEGTSVFHRVIHARWNGPDEPPYIKGAVCSNCGKVDIGGDYCRNCGAKMDLDVKH